MFSVSRSLDGDHRLQMLFAIGAGNAMESFDWGIYATFAVFFAPQFFDSGSSISNILDTFGVFAVGFIARPFGGLLFGWLADLRGRQLSMSLTIGVAAAGSLVIGSSPTHATIGTWAAVILVICRLVQGLAQGGELPSAQTYLSEVAPRQQRGLWSSLLYFSGAIGTMAGILLAAVLSTELTDEQMYDFGWRIPFILGGMFALFALYMRCRMAETEIFTQELAAAKARPGHVSVLNKIWKHPGLLVRVAGITVGVTVVYYVWAISAPAYAISVRGVPATAALWAGVFANLVYLAALVFWGFVSDKIGRKPVLLFGVVSLMVLLHPLNAIVRGQAWQLFTAMTIAMALIACTVSILPAVYAEMFPTAIRATGFGVPYSLVVALFGGTAPYLQTFFADKGIASAFIWYAIAMLAITVATIVCIPETKALDLSGATDRDGASER
ncbi:MFS transporter [Rhodococcus sp. WMMA185]|uniref:MFS transporter n=1 Tax=Rhodococcus sp. WMMA185 TaxID=679318 RepID=UPI001E5C52BB|nr:MFS transporter [Rhodococcus sp. WMMA185]